MTTPDAPEMYFILSSERTGEPPWGPRCVFWRPGAMGYTACIAEAGRYTLAEVERHADPPHHIAIPCSAVTIPSSQAKLLARHALDVSRWTPAKDTP